MKFHLQVDIWDFLSTEERNEISKNRQSADELMKRAKSSIAEDDEVFLCIDCFEELSVLRRSSFICLYCHHEEPAAFCDRCDQPIPEQLQNSTSELYEYEYSEGLTNFVQDYGIKEKSVCDECFKEIEKEVEAEKESQLLEDWEEEYHYSTRLVF